MTITVFLADDHAVVRDGLRALLDAQEDIDVVGDAADGLEAARQVEELRPDIVIMDVTNHAHIPYHFGVNLVDKVIKSGKIAYSAQ